MSVPARLFTGRRRRARRARFLRAVVTTVAVVAVLAAAVRTTWEQLSSMAAAGEAGARHVHSLLSRPGGGVLVGSHNGVFVIGEDGTARALASGIDVLTLAIDDKGAYFASAHEVVRGGADERQQQPAALGVLASTDSGRTWSTVPGTEGFDFHRIISSKGRFYAYDPAAQLIFASTDAWAWHGKQRVTIAGLAVSPDAPSRLLASDPEGVLASGDAGTTWERIAPNVFRLLEWSGDLIFGVTDVGEVFASQDQGRTWAFRSDLRGEPEAIAARSGSIYVSVAKRGLLVSKDEGRQWLLLSPLGRATGDDAA